MPDFDQSGLDPVQTFYAGAGVALAAGLILGAAMRPELVGDDRPLGPQILPEASAGRSTGPFDDEVSYAGFAGKLPDYVLGSDWKKAQEPVVATPPAEPDTTAAPDGGGAAAPAADDAPAPADAAGVDASARESAPPDAAADVAAAKADAQPAKVQPATAAPAADLDADAPPEATGDTRPAR